ncbi:DUF3568 family protein [Algisphaera agarilytica]|uniref:DUF3568 family protein n=1 Tax=Algisphaera agarilytica TaxID=1385975 RepID=UPI001C88D702|nr:DUF3568 family protein [Algisphaera agarilytica]
MITAAALAVPLTFVPGCGVELAVIGAAASAASQGAAVYKRGKLTGSWMGPFDLVVAAGEIAMGDLGFVITDSNGDVEEGKWKIVAVDEDGEKVTIKIDRKTHRLTEFQIDVTWFGQEATARLILKRMALAIDIETYEDGTGNIIRAYVPPPEPEASTEPEPAPPSEETP